MNYHDELLQMRESVARRKNSLVEPDAYGFDDPATLAGIRDALNKAKLEDGRTDLIVRRGLDAEGKPEAWAIVKDGDATLYVGNFSYTCPPRTDCS